ncbi:hypothetical protein B5X24_HaOG203805 [Helicoverpa armigera]|nr:hypothetical protein B5X24_HaOG203805 [Helicoverpa armigera]
MKFLYILLIFFVFGCSYGQEIPDGTAAVPRGPIIPVEYMIDKINGKPNAHLPGQQVPAPYLASYTQIQNQYDMNKAAAEGKKTP